MKTDVKIIGRVHGYNLVFVSVNEKNVTLTIKVKILQIIDCY